MMIRHRTYTRLVLMLAAAVACIGLAACGDDDTAGTTAGETTDNTDVTAPNVPDETSDSDDEPADDSEAGSDRAGTLTVDGTTYTFSPSICLADGAGSSVSGSGSDAGGDPVYVDLAAGDLSVYVGTDDPFSADPDYVANSMAGQGSLDETVDGSAVEVEASFTSFGSVEVIAEGSLSVTC